MKGAKVINRRESSKMSFDCFQNKQKSKQNIMGAKKNFKFK